VIESANTRTALRRLAAAAAVALGCCVFANASHAGAVCTVEAASHVAQIGVTPDVQVTTLAPSTRNGALSGSTIGDDEVDFDCGGATTSDVDTIRITARATSGSTPPGTPSPRA
jgi:hypothetical protein